MKLLYKYMANPEHLLKDGYIRATQLSALNDPFEATYCVEGLSDLCPYFELDSSAEELIDFIETKRSIIGVISLTEARDNLLMWSHYANEHKGAVVGLWAKGGFGENIFENLHNSVLDNSCLYEEYKMFLGDCFPVIYRKQPRYRVDSFDFDYSNISVEGNDRILFEIFQQKSDEWIYEKEHRITLRLDQADKVIVQDIHRLKNKHVLNKLLSSKHCYEDDKGMFTVYLEQIEDEIEREAYASKLVDLSFDPTSLYLFKVSKGAMKSITYGLSCDVSMINKCSDYAYNYGRFEQWQATLSRVFYTLAFSEIVRT